MDKKDSEENEKNVIENAILKYRKETKESVLIFLRGTIPIFFGFTIGALSETEKMVQEYSVLKILLLIMYIAYVLPLVFYTTYLKKSIDVSTNLLKMFREQGSAPFKEKFEKDRKYESFCISFMSVCFCISLLIIFIFITIRIFS